MADFGRIAGEIKSWQESEAWLQLVDPRTNEAIGGPEAPARILLTSPLSERWLSMEKAYHAQLRLARETSNNTRFTVDDVERFEAHRVRCYMAVTRTWENIDRDGAPLACTPVNMEWLYSMKWISDQLLDFMNNLRNFGAPGNSPNGLSGDVLEEAEKKSLIGAAGNSP